MSWIKLGMSLAGEFRPYLLASGKDKDYWNTLANYGVLKLN